MQVALAGPCATVEEWPLLKSGVPQRGALLDKVAKCLREQLSVEVGGGLPCFFLNFCINFKYTKIINKMKKVSSIKISGNCFNI
jgi:hypothetical protein